MSGGGTASEDLVEEICERMFFRDFVVRSPKFRKASGLEKEAADVLVLDDRTLLAIQVKSRAVVDPESEVALQRIEKRITEGIGQLKTLRRALGAKQLTHVVTLRGVEIPVQLSPDSKLIGMVILDILDEELHEIEKRPAILAGFDVAGDIPTHVFLRSTFQSLAEELDTFPDFLRYLETRELLYSKGILTALTDELDFLALYKTNYPLVQQAVEGNCDMLIVGEGGWSEFVANSQDAKSRRAKANEPSYLVDGMIEYFHSAISRLETAAAQDEGPDQSVAAYFAVVSELARLPRIQRRAVGEKIQEKLKSATTKPFSFAVMIEPSRNNGLFFLCTAKARSERANALRNLSIAAAHHAGISNIIGIATEPEDTRERTFDAMLFRDLPLEPEDAEVLRAIASGTFGPMKRTTRQEWE